MKTYIAYKNQIQGFNDVSETVKTTEKTAASSVHLLKTETASLNYYIENINRILARLFLFYQKKNHPLLRKNLVGEKTLIIITADKGLVGGLWHKLVDTYLNKTGVYDSVIVVGEKGKDYLKEEGARDVKLFGEIDLLANYVFNEFEKLKFAKVDILYPQFNSLAEQKPAFVSFLPFEFALKNDPEDILEKDLALPIFEPSKKMVFDRLLQKYIGVYLNKIVLETKLSELSARTVAMEHAGAKTKEFIWRLTASFRKEHRRIITQRQLESFTAHKVL